MGGLKTLLVLLVVVPLTCRAAEDPIVATFAACTGRFSAELEHAWLMRDADAPAIERRREGFVDLLNAVLGSDRRPAALNLRLQAKVAHAALLSNAAFSGDPARSARARRRARSEIDYCTGFLLAP